MKRLGLTALVLALFLSVFDQSIKAQSQCIEYEQGQEDYYSGCANTSYWYSTITHHKYWNIYWYPVIGEPPAASRSQWVTTAFGRCVSSTWGASVLKKCDPIFHTPRTYYLATPNTATWEQRLVSQDIKTIDGNYQCVWSQDHYNSTTDSCGTAICEVQDQDCPMGYYFSNSSCSCQPYSPIVIDVAGNGFNLTNTAGGVSFDLDGDAAAEHLSWTSGDSDDAWLALDRNINGKIDDGRELFGNFSAQPAPSKTAAAPNGYLALAEFDKPGSGGNDDGVINGADGVFTSLRLWQDVNHNGISEAGELHTLPSLSIAAVSLDYRESMKIDEHGNLFKYRARIRDDKGAQAGRWSWDVFLVKAP